MPNRHAHRGVYRGVYSVLLDDPDYQRLTPNARLVLLTMRMARYTGPGAIFRYYREVVAQQTGLTGRQVESCLQELVAHRWIEHEAPVIWIRNGLRYDPSLRLANDKHRAAVEQSIRELPKLKIVLNFCDYYELSYPFDSHSNGSPTQRTEDRGQKTEDRGQRTEDGLRSGKPSRQSADADPGMAKDWSKAPWPSPEAFAHLYNMRTPDNCPAVEIISPRRRERIREALRLYPAQEWWEELYREYHASKFLSGKAARGPGHANWAPDFDWLLQASKGIENYVKVHEGKYRG